MPETQSHSKNPAVRVLSADDDPAVRGHLRMMLEMAGFDTSEEFFVKADNGLDAYRKLRALFNQGREAHLLISDWEISQ
jgi:PleD family two-component response regulator